MTKATPRIVYVPGLMPKPPAGKHRGALQNSLAAGLRMVGADTSPAEALELYAWNFGFYGEDRPWQLDMASVADPRAVPSMDTSGAEPSSRLNSSGSGSVIRATGPSVCPTQ